LRDEHSGKPVITILVNAYYWLPATETSLQVSLRQDSKSEMKKSKREKGPSWDSLEENPTIR
jgi:hypothetical protein